MNVLRGSPYEVAARVAPDLVLLDLRLPEMSGVEVAMALGATSDPPAVILISSDADAAGDPAVMAAPVRGFLPKRDLTCAAIDELLR